MIGPETAVLVSGGVVAVAAAGGAVWKVGRGIHHVAEDLRGFLNDWNGVPARPGHPSTMGVPERLQSIETRLGAVEAQMQPNGGSSLRDVMDRIEDVQSNPPTRQE